MRTQHPSSYHVLARAYRPQRFDQVIGQDALVTLLKSGLSTGRLGHALLFSGVRGTGKTTMARLLAKALNCPELNDGEPCNMCDSCLAIQGGHHMDVVEMDAASHTGVDDVRSIMESVAYAPVQGRHKVYIIDEVHMLSKSAFNALLKTLEEPPPAVTFIFATTETHKIPATIISRCMHFQLRRIDIQILIDHYRDVCKSESVEMDDDALHLVARAADGSVRDGLSILNQIITLPHRPITSDHVRKILGWAHHKDITSLWTAAVEGRTKDILSLAKTIYDEGATPPKIIEDLMIMAYDALMHRIDHPSSSETLGFNFLNTAWQILSKGLADIKQSVLPFESMVIVLLRLCHVTPMPGPGDIKTWIHQGRITTDPTPHHGKPSMDHTKQSTASSANPKQIPTEKRPTPGPESVDSLLKWLDDQREVMLADDLRRTMRVVTFSPEKIIIQDTPDLPKGFEKTLKAMFQKNNIVFDVELSQLPGDDPLYVQQQRQKQNAVERAQSHPLVRQAMDAFPQSKMTL